MLTNIASKNFRSLLLRLSPAALALFFVLASCGKEEYQCECVTEDENGNVTAQRTVSAEFESNNQARVWCEDNEEMDSTASVTFSTECGLQ